MVSALKGIGLVYLHAVVDTLGCYALGFVHFKKQPQAAVAVLHNDMLPFYARLDLPMRRVLTDHGREFCGTERHPYELYLRSTTSSTGRPRSVRCAPTGFVERFQRYGAGGEVPVIVRERCAVYTGF